jgi:hypothetical protein
MKQARNTLTNDRLARLLMLTAFLVAIVTLLTGPASATVENEHSNHGWYTGLEYKDLPRQQPAVQNEYTNHGWYTGLEYEDMPHLQPASTADGPLDKTLMIGFGAVLAALLVGATVIATRSRSGRMATD